jgi:hypothetical protein
LSQETTYDEPPYSGSSKRGFRNCPGPGPLKRLSGLRVFHSQSVFCGTFVWAHRGLIGRKRYFPARAVVEGFHAIANGGAKAAYPAGEGGGCADAEACGPTIQLHAAAHAFIGASWPRAAQSLRADLSLKKNMLKDTHDYSCF